MRSSTQSPAAQQPVACTRDTLLLHICCGPCATATEEFWRQRSVSVVGFFYNPNVQPFLEHRRRLEGARTVAQARAIRLVEDTFYDPALWFREVGLTGPERCRACIGMRLKETARRAAALGCGAFSTTLSISPWQNHEAIQQAGREAAARHGISFLYEDLRPLYRESVRQSKELGLYRQQYCGCILSEWERYRDARTLG